MNEELKVYIDKYCKSITKLQKQYEETDSLTEKVKLLQLINMESKELIRCIELTK